MTAWLFQGQGCPDWYKLISMAAGRGLRVEGAKIAWHDLIWEWLGEADSTENSAGVFGAKPVLQHTLHFTCSSQEQGKVLKLMQGLRYS